MESKEYLMRQILDVVFGYNNYKKLVFKNNQYFDKLFEKYEAISIVYYDCIYEIISISSFVPLILRITYIYFVEGSAQFDKSVVYAFILQSKK